MFRRRIHRLSTTLALVASLLLSQWAMANYVCPVEGQAEAAMQAMLERMARYAEQELARGERLPAITRHMLGLLSHSKGAREYRRLLSEGARERDAGPDLIRRAGLVAAGGTAQTAA